MLIQILCVVLYILALPIQVLAQDKAFQASIHIDAYYQQDWNAPDAPLNVGIEHHLEASHGFALSQGGLSLGFDANDYGGQLDLRFGDIVPRLGLSLQDNSLVGVLQAYGYWSLTDVLLIDFGRFKTIFGIESPDSFSNLNYSRGAVYMTLLPSVIHTGLRVNVAMGSKFGISLLAVSNEDPSHRAMTPAMGGQLIFQPIEGVNVYAGYLGSSNSPDEGEIDHFGDFSFYLDLREYSIRANLVLATDRNGSQEAQFWV